MGGAERRSGHIASLLVALVATLSACKAGRDASATVESAQDSLRRGQLATALTLVEDELARAHGNDNSLETWRLRLLKGDLLVMRRDLPGVASLVEATPPAGSSYEPVRARLHYLKARLAVEGGDLSRGMIVAREARAWPGVDLDTQLDLDLLIGRIYLQQGDWAAAEEALGPVLSPSADRYRQLQALNNLGNGRLRRGRYDEALAWLERALGLSEFEGSTLYATAMANAGICYSRLGLFDRAINIQRRAVEIQRVQGAPKALADALGSLGVSLGLRGSYREALPFLDEAFQVSKDNGQRRDAALWANNLASAHSRLGDWDRAAHFNDESRELGTGLDGIREVYNTLVAGDIALARSDVSGAARLYEQARADPEGAPAVRWSAEAGLAATAIAAQRPGEAGRHFEAALNILERTQSDLVKTDYKLPFLTQLIEFYQDYVDALVAQGRSDRALEIADSSRGRVLAERQRVDAPARTDAAAFRQVAGRSRTVLLSYWLAPTRSFLWIVTGGGVRRVDLPPAAEIESAVRDYRTLIDNSLVDPLTKAGTAGDRLYSMLVAPAKVPAGSSVVIVPDGSLHSINFETLPVDGARRHYWIEDAEIQIAPSLSMLTVSARPKPRDPALLLIGNPTPRAPEFPALSYAPAEMTSIVRHFTQEQVTAYDSAKATPAVYRDAPLDRFSMIHFTAHATANVESPLDSAVVLSGPATAFKLYARDVADKPLNAELVTVSACRSAGERAYSGEGLVGFAWAFLRAGAKRVVAGLWDVDDRSTARLMDDMYRGIAAGDSPAHALRAAKLKLIKAGNQLARPYYWGPFQLFTARP